jgi:predicted nucleotide-binding protein
MPSKKHYLFVSYAQEDFFRVRVLVQSVEYEFARRDLPVSLWMDFAELKPGEQWDAQISEALKASVGVIIFLSARALQSSWFRQEMWMAATQIDRLVITVVLDEPLDELPLKGQIHLRFVEPMSEQATLSIAREIADATERYLQTSPEPRSVVTRAELPVIAAGIARDVRASVEGQVPEGAPKAVFVVHGHDSDALTQLESFLHSVGVEALVLSRQDESPQSLFQRFLTIGGRARFAIVLLGADDYGASRLQYDASGVGDRALQFRARQNVILELGFFYGKLGWENVFVVHKSPDRVFPNFERPSDLDGVVFDSIEDPRWREKLARKLSEAKFELRKQQD